MFHKLFVPGLALLLNGVAFAQFSINGTELVTAAPQVVDPTKDIGTNTGADIDLKNSFKVAITVEIRNAAGVVVASVGLLKESTLTVEIGLAAGNYEIFVYEAGKPATAVDCGDLVVL